MDQQIIRVIRGRRVLSLAYEGRPIDLEPYTYGRMTSGKDFLFGWQRTGAFIDWRVLWPHRARSIRVTEQSFDAPRPGYHATLLGRVAVVFCQIEGVPGPCVQPAA